MSEKRVIIDLPTEVWQKVSIATAMISKTKKEWVAEVLRDASQTIIEGEVSHD